MNFEIIDLVVIFVYLAFVITIAIIAGGKKRKHRNNAKEQYLAGKSLTFWESISSIIATETSALTFLGIPAIALSGNFSFIQIYIGAIFGRLVIARLILPILYDKELTAYSSLSSGVSKKVMASIFVMSKILSVGVRLYSGSILIAIFFGLSPYTAVVFTLTLTFFYTLFGGLKAVVRTDIVQMGLFITGGIVAHFLIPDIADRTWLEMIYQAFDAGKLSIQIGDSPWGFVTGIIAGFLFDIATHGTDQDFMQRLLAGKNLKSAQRAIFFSSFASITTGLLFLGVGALLWSYTQVSPLPLGIGPDQSFAHFITEFFPPGFRGLMLAGILAATMSTVDSSINAICACLHSDIFTQRKKSLQFYLKRDTFLASLFLLVVAIIASSSSSVLKLGLTIQSWTAGPMLAFFIGHLYFKIKPNLTSSLSTLIMGLVGVAINTIFLENSWHWNTYWGVTLGLIGMLVFNIKQLQKR